MASVMKVIGYLQVLMVFVVPFAMLAESEGLPGEEKKREVIAHLKEEMHKLGMKVPSWLERYWDTILGLMVDVVVWLLNKTGFFEHSGTSSEV